MFYIILNGDSRRGISHTVVQTEWSRWFSATLEENQGVRRYNAWRGQREHLTWEGARPARGHYAEVVKISACSLEHALEISKGWQQREMRLRAFHRI